MFAGLSDVLMCAAPFCVRAYLYLDEAHSIGCMGAHGKGLCEHAGVDPKDVDVLMGEQCMQQHMGIVPALRFTCAFPKVPQSHEHHHDHSIIAWEVVFSRCLLCNLACGVSDCAVKFWFLVCAGTFTKSFGSAGGYIAGSKQLITYLRRYCPAHLYATSMAPGVMQQIISAIKLLQVGGGLWASSRIAANNLGLLKLLTPCAATNSMLCVVG